MRCCTNLPKLLRLVLPAFILLGASLSIARADGIQVRKAEGFFSENSYQISADFDVNLNFVVQQALEQGVSLYFVSEFTLTHPRWYWLDEAIAHSEQTTRLSYNPLTRQYRIAHGTLFQNFASLNDALRIIGHQSSGFIPTELLKTENNYVASVRLHLDVTQLPKPLQVNALTGDSWNLDSGWYRWFLRPDSSSRN